MSQRRVFNLMIGSQPFLALSAADLQPGEAGLSPAQAWHLLERELRNPRDVVGMTQLWKAIGKTSASGFGNIRPQVLKEAFESGKWVLRARARQLSSEMGVKAESVKEQLKAAKVVTTWVEMEVVNEDGQPMADQPFRCMMPNGSIEQGRLDKRGRVRFDGIDPGNCVFSLTELAPEVWEKIG